MRFHCLGVIAVRSRHPFEVRGALNFSNGLHQRFTHNDSNIRARISWNYSQIMKSKPGTLIRIYWRSVPFSSICQTPIVCRLQGARCRANVELKHFRTRIGLWEWNVNSFLKTATDGRVQGPGNVGCAQYQNATLVVPNAIHLNQKFSLNSSRGLTFAFPTRSTQWINLVNEDDRRFLFAGQFKQLSDETARQDKSLDKNLTAHSPPSTLTPNPMTIWKRRWPGPRWPQLSPNTTFPSPVAVAIKLIEWTQTPYKRIPCHGVRLPCTTTRMSNRCIQTKYR